MSWFTMKWRRLLLFAIALNCMLFYRGCDTQGNLDFTVGVAPFQELRIDYDSEQFSVEVREFSPLIMLLSIALTMASLLGLAFRSPSIRRFLEARTQLVLLIICFMIFNLAIYPNPVWSYLVYSPTLYALGGIETLLQEFDGGLTIPIADTISRLYFVVFFATLALICRFSGYLFRRKFRSKRSDSSHAEANAYVSE